MAEPVAAPAPSVDIVLPDGGAASVPETDLTAALAAGARVAPKLSSDEQFLQSGIGQGLTALLGAGRSATFGATDAIVAEGAGILGGESARRSTLQALRMAKEANPYADMAGEGAGLLLGGGGITGAGDAAEGAVAGRLGEGLLGKTAAAGVRGAAEGALMGAQGQMTEDRLGDHALNGEKLFASMGKDALFGLGAGAATGAAFEGAASLFRRPGPASAAVLDEIAGAPGAGRALRDDAAGTEDLIARLQGAGATSEQASKMAAEVKQLAAGKVEAGEAKSIYDKIIDGYVDVRSGSNAQMREDLANAIKPEFQKLADRDAALSNHALDLKGVGDRVLKAERTVNDLQFKYKADQMAKLVDPALETAARDSYAVMLQDTNKTLDFLESLAGKGGSEGAVSKLRKEVTDAAKFQATLGRTAEGKIAKLDPKQMHELFIRADKLKRAVGNFSGAGKSYGLTEAQGEFRDLYEKLRVGLEDESSWGRAGQAQKAWNETFSTDLGRADDFANRFQVKINNEEWSKVPEMDAGKVKGFLKSLGDEATSQQGLTSTESWMARNDARIAKMEEFGTLSPADRKAIEEGKAALSEFRTKMGSAKKDAEIVAKLEQQRAMESAPLMGGMTGLLMDTVTRPLTTVERLVRVKNTATKVESAIKSGVDNLFGKGSPLATKLAPRAAGDVAKEIGQIRELARNPAMLQERIGRMIGDLGKHAPQIADEVRANAVRAVHYLAQEAPPAPAASRPTPFGESKAQPRFAAQQLSEWDAKRQAVLGDGKQLSPEVVLSGLKNGRLNRDAVRLMEMTSPRMFAEMQDMTRQKLAQLDAQGKLAQMPYNQKATIAALIKVPADSTWEGTFIQAMQATKAAALAPAPTQTQIPTANMGVSKREVQINTGAYQTEAQQIEGAGSDV